MQPVRLKVYGLITLTKRTFLILQAIEVVFLFALLAVGIGLPRPMAFETNRPLVSGLLDFFPWLILLLLLVDGFETFIIWRRFTQRERFARGTKPLKEQSGESDGYPGAEY